MGKHSAEQQIVISGSAQECFDAITDYETFPDWQAAVQEIEVIKRDRQGRGKLVELTVDAKVKTITYKLHYYYEEPTRVWWDFVEGDVKEIDGQYTFEERDDGTTLATYELAIDPGVWVPGRIAKMLNEQVMKRSVEDLKRRVESARDRAKSPG